MKKYQLGIVCLLPVLLTSCKSLSEYMNHIQVEAFSYLKRAINKTDSKQGNHQIDILYPYGEEEIMQGKNPYWRYVYDDQGQAVLQQGKTLDSLSTTISIIKDEEDYIYNDYSTNLTFVDASYYQEALLFLNKPNYKYFTKLSSLSDFEKFASTQVNLDLARYEYQCATLSFPLKTQNGKTSVNQMSFNMRESDEQTEISINYTTTLKVETVKSDYTSLIERNNSYSYNYIFDHNDILQTLEYHYVFDYQESKKESKTVITSNQEDKTYFYTFSYPKSVDCFTLDDIDKTKVEKPSWYNPVLIHDCEFFYVSNNLSSGIDLSDIQDPYFQLDKDHYEIKLYKDKNYQQEVTSGEVISITSPLYGKVEPKEGYAIIYSFYHFSFGHEYDEYASYYLDDLHPSIDDWDIKLVKPQENYTNTYQTNRDYDFQLKDIDGKENISTINIEEGNSYIFNYESDENFFKVAVKNQQNENKIGVNNLLTPIQI